MEPNDAYQATLAAYQQAGQAPQAQPQQGAGMGSPLANARAVFMLANGGSVDDQYAAKLAQQYLGIPVSGVTPDGSSLQLQNGQIVPIAQVLGQLGAQVSGFKPLQADYSQVQPGMRASMQALPDDFRRKQYLEHFMRQVNPEGTLPMIQGSGDDWFVFDDRSGKWVAATNAPGLDMSDMAGAGVTGLKLAGSLAGGAIGAAGGLGVGSVPGAIAGAAAGGAGADALSRAAITMADPTYAAIRDQMGEGEVLADIGKGAAIDAVGAAIPTVGGALLGKAMAPLSRMAQGSGAVAENVGSLAGGLGRGVDNAVGHDVAAAFIPGAAEMQLGGLVAQLPAMGTRGAVRGIGAIGESGLGRNLLGEEAAAGMSKFARNTLAAGSAGGDPSTREIASRIGRSIGRGISTRLPEPTPAEFAPYLADAKIYRGSLLDLGTEEQLAKELWRDEMKARFGAAGRTAGSRIGSVVQGVEDLGKSAEGVARGIAVPLVKTLRYGGGALERGGAAARRAGEIGQGRGLFSLEDQLYGRIGAEEALGGLGRASMDAERYRRQGPSTYLAGSY